MREARGPEWTDWLTQHDIPALSGVDTRSLTLHLREHGALRAALVVDGRGVDEALELARSQPSMSGQALAGRVSTEAPYVFSEGDVCVAVVDYGTKRSILRQLAAAGAAVTVFPHDVDAETLARLRRRRALERPRAIPSRSSPRPPRSATCSAACRCSASASATSCSRSRPA